ncbi:MAG: 30S ribosomal protein S12 methylthiotransferase RimO [Nitrospirota bacterium]
MAKVSLVSLGCPKNLVDSGNLLNRLKEEGIFYTSNPAESDIVMVNTCGFIEAAKRESIEEILRLSKFKDNKKGLKLIVFGCLAKRYGKDLRKEIPEIDSMWGVGDEEKILEYCKKATDGTGPSADEENFIETPYAYMKIAEGCDRGCSYCAIPGIRGRFRSRTPEDILGEAENHISSGVKELILIAQDITSYGNDINGYDLSRLIKDISSIDGDFWIRLLYLYPASINDDLLDTINAEDKVCKYIDMPLQHSEDKILKLMGRGGSKKYFEKLISKIRDNIPGVNIRTTLIAGFPQETEEDFNHMADFVRDMEFDRLGVFIYSKEEGTPAYRIKGQIPKHIKEKRRNRIMEIQSAVSLKKNKSLSGRTFKALVDDVDGGIAVARIYSQAPEIDGIVLINEADAQKGDFVRVKIEDAYDYDLKGSIVR